MPDAGDSMSTTDPSATAASRLHLWAADIALCAAVFASSVSGAANAVSPAAQVTVSIASGLVDHPLTGRMFIILSRQQDGEPRLASPFAYYTNDPDWPIELAPLFARDVEN